MWEAYPLDLDAKWGAALKRYLEAQAVHVARLDRHEAIMASLAQTLDAIKDLLDRGTGRDA